MGFEKFQWVDRLVAEPNRRTIVDTTTAEQKTVNVFRDEGEIQEEGTPFSKDNMNYLEDRIAKMFPVKIEDGGTGTTDAAGVQGIRVGKRLTGISVTPTEGSSVVASEGAEIFGDYRERTFSGGIASTGNISSGEYSYAEGYATTSSGRGSHAEGRQTQATSAQSHAEGYKTISSGASSHAEGFETSASGRYGSHSEGFKTNAVGEHSHAGGYATIANTSQYVVGRCNTDLAAPTSITDMTGTLFIIGNGTSETARANAFRVTANGNVYAAAQFHSSGAGLSEMFEWSDRNINNEDRRGLFVTLDGEKIRIANPSDSYILGVIDPTPFVIGDAQSEQWKDKYLKDVFGEKITEEIQVAQTINEFGDTIPAHIETRYVLNPAYNGTKEYISREERKEFAPITSKGKVVMVDDGTCEINKYCKVGINGVATYSEDNYKVRVLNRIDSNHIYVYIDSVFINN